MDDTDSTLTTTVLGLDPTTVDALVLYGTELQVLDATPGASLIASVVFAGEAMQVLVRLGQFIDFRRTVKGLDDEWCRRAKGALAPLFFAAQRLGRGPGSDGRVVVAPATVALTR